MIYAALEPMYQYVYMSHLRYLIFAVILDSEYRTRSNYIFGSAGVSATNAVARDTLRNTAITGVNSDTECVNKYYILRQTLRTHNLKLDIFF